VNLLFDHLTIVHFIVILISFYMLFNISNAIISISVHLPAVLQIDNIFYLLILIYYVMCSLYSFDYLIIVYHQIYNYLNAYFLYCLIYCYLCFNLSYYNALY